MSQTLSTTPYHDGFRMPIESDPHDCCWMLFPYDASVWRNNAQPAQRAIARIAATIAQFEPVIMGVKAGYEQIARSLLPDSVKLVSLEYDDSWMRDCGATFVVNQNGGVRGVDWRFNGWGEMTLHYKLDALVARDMLEMTNLDRYQADFVLEGGSIHTDGQGTLYTTQECLLNPNRNPSLSQSDIEQRLVDYLGVEKIVWLDRGVYEDETSGHVDNLCCVIRPGEVALTWTDNQQDPQYDISHEAYDCLMSQSDAQGRQLKVYKLHQPTPMYRTEAESEGVEADNLAHPRGAGDRLAASYVNFYIANGGVVVPQFDDANDRLAIETLQVVFPERRVVGIPGREILLGGGNIHCITQQQPSPQHR